MKYAVFLRAINVGTTNRVKMADLKEICAGVGFAGVGTYLQSGNLVLEADDEGEAVAQRLEGAFLAHGLERVSAMVREERELEELIAMRPFDAFEPGAYRRLVTLLRTPAPDGALPAFAVPGVGVVAVRPREVLTVVEAGAMPGVDVNGLLAKKAKVEVTTRFWNVVEETLGVMRRA